MREREYRTGEREREQEEKVKIKIMLVHLIVTLVKLRAIYDFHSLYEVHACTYRQRLIHHNLGVFLISFN